jgi:hypothetical protein
MIVIVLSIPVPVGIRSRAAPVVALTGLIPIAYHTIQQPAEKAQGGLLPTAALLRGGSSGTNQ